MIKSVLSQMVQKNMVNKTQNLDTTTLQSQNKNFIFYLDVSPLQDPLKISIQTDPLMTIQQGIQTALSEFQKILKSQEIELVKEMEYFVPRLSRKNGRPKKDMPSLCTKQKFSELKINIISLQIIQKHALVHKKQSKERTVSNSSIASQIQLNYRNKQIVEGIVKPKKSGVFSFCC